jgi:hypothetical protein
MAIKKIEANCKTGVFIYGFEVCLSRELKVGNVFEEKRMTDEARKVIEYLKLLQKCWEEHYGYFHRKGE